jgi:hypothetical protein
MEMKLGWIKLFNLKIIAKERIALKNKFGLILD